MMGHPKWEKTPGNGQQQEVAGQEQSQNQQGDCPVCVGGSWWEEHY